MNTPLHRLISLAAVCGMLSPMAASAAALTVTQQGVVSASAPKGAQRAVFLEATFQAECDSDVTVSSVQIRHRGLGEATDLERVYATEGETRLTKTRSLDSSDRTATLDFIPALKVKACSTKRVQIRGDFSVEAAVAGEHGLLIENVAADAPVTLTSTTVSKITTKPVSTGAVSVTLLPLSKSLLFGKNRTVARFRLEADKYADQDIVGITFTNAGKATNDDLQNLHIVDRKGNLISTTLSAMLDDKAHIAFDPALRLDHNDEVLLELRADIVASKRRTVRFTLEEPSDLEATVRAR